MDKIELIERILRHNEVSALCDAVAVMREIEAEGAVELDYGNSDKEVFDPDKFAAAHKYSKIIRAKAKGLMLKSAGAYEVYKTCLLFDSPYDFDSYCLYVEFDRPANKKFYAPRRNVLLPLTVEMQALSDGRLDFLGISLPPRVGKSTLCIFFITWIMGKRPDVANVMSGHSDKLTEPFHREVLNILTDRRTYLWHDVFPHVPIVSTSAKNETINLGAEKRFATFTARPIGGTLTGAVEIGPGGCLYVDDIIEDLEESRSPDRLDNKYNAYLNQLKDRKKDGAFELMVGTRWNVFDPLGRIMMEHSDDPRYKFIVIPAVDDEGHSNFNYPYGLGFSDEYYADMKKSLEDSEWCAKYLGRPYIREGLLFPRGSLRRFYDLPDEEPDAIWAICDPAQGGGDDTFLPVFYQYGNDHYMVDCVCSSALPNIADELCAEMLVKYKVKQCQYEINSAGGRTADNVRDKVVKKGGVTSIVKKHTQSNKETKILAESTWVKEHILFLDDKVIAPTSDYAKAMNLLCNYVVIGKNKKDDVPDGLSQYALFVANQSQNVIKLIKRPF